MAMGSRVLPVLFVLISTFNRLIPLGKASEICVSPGGRFPRFASEGKPPNKVAKGPKDLTLCRIFRKNTCCDVAQTYLALLSTRRLASAGEASQECLHLWELLECAICHPRVGTRPGPPVICASLCDMVLNACTSAYFSIDTKTQVLSPCGLSDTLCGKASEWASNGTEFCHLAGFAVHPSGIRYSSNEESFCYGMDNINSVTDVQKPIRTKPPQKVEIIGLLQDFEQWLMGMPLTERVSWAVGGMVLTAGLLFLSKRKSYSRRQREAAIFRTAKKLEAKINQQPYAAQGSGKGMRR